MVIRTFFTFSGNILELILNGFGIIFDGGYDDLVWGYISRMDLRNK